MSGSPVATLRSATTSPEDQGALSRLGGFHPGWFGSVMGTAIVSIAVSRNPGNIAALASPTRVFAQVMAVIATALAVVLIVPYLARLFLHRDAALADLRDPVAGALYSTLPGGILVLSATAVAVGPSVMAPATVRDIVAGLDWVGVPLALLMSVLFAQVLFLRAGFELERVNGGWFIPPVVNIIVPLVLTPLVPGSSPATARALLLTSYAFWGMGFFLYLLILVMLFHRLVVHPLPQAGLAPSLWIGLGPIGVGALAAMNMAVAGTPMFGTSSATLELVSRLIATALWGFGAWWLIAAVVLLIYYLRRGPFPYGIGWWGFTFPLGAYSVATLTLARSWGLSGLEDAGAALFVLLVIFWLIVVAGTLLALKSGEIWRPGQHTAAINTPYRQGGTQ